MILKYFPNKKKELEILIQTIRIYSQVIGMELGIEKCAMLIMKKEKREITDRRGLPNQKSIRTPGESDNRDERKCKKKKKRMPQKNKNTS